MKNFLLLIEDEVLWKKFKDLIERDINSEIRKLIEKRVKGKGRGNE